MNPRTIQARSVLRDRRRGTIPAYRLRLPNGALAMVRRYAHQADRASYKVRHGMVYGVWPPNEVTIGELCRWS